VIKYDPDVEGYTDDEKIIFDRWITDNNKLEMYVYFRTALPSKFTGLYHSFGRGKKGYYQQIIDNLIRQGGIEFEQYVILYQQCHDIESEVSETASNLIKEG